MKPGIFSIKHDRLILVFFAVTLFGSYPQARAADEAVISFYGAARCMTGSCHLLDTGLEKILLDCGSFMEPRLLKRNDAIPFDAGDVDITVLSHAHMDHSGRLPLLFAGGYRGAVICAPPTRALTDIMLNVQMIIAENEPGSVQYSRYDLEQTMSNFMEIDYKEPYKMLSGTCIRLYPAQHILGSAMAKIEFGPSRDRKSLIYTGDFGNAYNTILDWKTHFTSADYLVIESTYGGKSHGQYEEQRETLYKIMRDTVYDGGITVIPSFVLARTQKILGYIYLGIRQGKIPDMINIYVDSPSASRITRIYADNTDKLRNPFRSKPVSRRSAFHSDRLHLYRTFRQIKRPAVVIVPTADATAGKVLDYLRKYIGNSDTRICFVSSYQEPGSLGEKLIEGVRRIEIDGERYSVRAKIYELGAFYGHGDQDQILDWLKSFKRLKRVFIVHGQPDGMRRLKSAIEERFSFPAVIPELDETYVLSTGQKAEK